MLLTTTACSPDARDQQECQHLLVNIAPCCSADSMKEDARKMVLTMVDMERSYLTADVFRDIISQNAAVDGAEQPNMLRTLSG